ncbi:MAG: hypothetical protein JSW66_14130 [Phycisphaerales bacterium]|nr:MAG: hypothetical protein JSW66_14130 [Phycisphaerales bacterium]
MTTEAQVKANQQNAQKSTGPRTAEGKAAVANNALKHGLFAAQDVLSIENQDEYDLLREQMLADLAPVGAVELMLTHRIVSLTWRLRRAERMQDEFTEDMVQSHMAGIRVCLGRRKPKEPRDEPEYLALGQVAKKDWYNSQLIERLFEYERRIERSLYRAIAQLRRTQYIRELEQLEAQKKEELEKQSQSGPVGMELPNGFNPTAKQIKAFAKTTYGDSPPFWVKAAMKHASNVPQARSRSSRRRGGMAKQTAMSMLKL